MLDQILISEVPTSPSPSSPPQILITVSPFPRNLWFKSSCLSFNCQRSRHSRYVADRKYLKCTIVSYHQFNLLPIPDA